MKEYKLKDEDYKRIKELAHSEFMSTPSDYEGLHLCKCFTNGLISFINSKNLIIKDGKVYEQKNSKDS